MKVHIGPYRKYFGVVQLAELLKYVGIKKNTREKISEFLGKTFINTFLLWLESKQKRKIKIKIDNYDVWSADHTLALVILPTLLKLKEVKQSYAHVDDDDVPDNLKTINFNSLSDDQYRNDALDEEKWYYVLNEIIWAFKTIVDTESDEQFYTGTIEFTDNGIVNSDDYSFDKEGYDKHQARIKNGLMLFGKYYQALWD